jgi:hypothetical protein
LVEGKTAFDYYQQLESNQALKSNGSFVRTMQIAGIQAPYEGAFWPTAIFDFSALYAVSFSINEANINACSGLLKCRLVSRFFHSMANIVLRV